MGEPETTKLARGYRSMFAQELAKTYTGMKTLKAWPCNRGDYNAYRGWTIPTDEDPQEPGYLVEYTADEGKANHPNHHGYVSWSPADVFEKSYKEDVPEWRVRLVIERMELSDKLRKLAAFIESSKFAELDEYQRSLLQIQHGYMAGYADVLSERALNKTSKD